MKNSEIFVVDFVEKTILYRLVLLRRDFLGSFLDENRFFLAEEGPLNLYVSVRWICSMKRISVFNLLYVIWLDYCQGHEGFVKLLLRHVHTFVFRELGTILPLLFAILRPFLTSYTILHFTNKNVVKRILLVRLGYFC